MITSKLSIFFLISMMTSLTLVAQNEKLDTTVINKLKHKALYESQVMDILSFLTDVNGPRLTNSPGYKSAAAYALKTLESWGVSNAHYESWGKFGRGWQAKKFSLQLTEPYNMPLTAYPNAWSPSVKGVKAEVIWIDAKTEKDLKKYKGLLKGKIILIENPVIFSKKKSIPEFLPDANRLSDSTLLKMANDLPLIDDSNVEIDSLAIAKFKLCQLEKPIAVICPTFIGEDGIVNTAASIVFKTDKLIPSRSEEAVNSIPQVSISKEQWNQIKRMIIKNVRVHAELDMENEFFKPEDGFNVIAEILGSDLKDEIVMIGGHLDSWHAATGSTDNASGVAVCMEAMRIIKELGLKPRRTIRIGLWGGEEQGLSGSKGYVKTHLAERTDKSGGWNVNLDSVHFKDEYKTFSVYFNMDEGTGKFRGIFMEHNEKVRPIFKSWFTLFSKMGASTLTSQPAGGSDHTSFDSYLLPAFHFIQDPIDYETNTWHTNMDLYDKVLQDDLKHNVAIMASFAWLAAMRDEKFPRKER